MLPRHIAREARRAIAYRPWKPHIGGGAMSGAVQNLYGDIWGAEDAAFEATVDASLHPRDSDCLFELFGRYGVGAGDVVLDVGCRDAR